MFDTDDQFFTESDALAVRAPLPMLPQCGKCGLQRGCRSPKMPVDGRGERSILIVGERPGKDEDRENRAFAGATGQKVRDKLREVDIDLRRDCWLTNAIICAPDHDPIPATVDFCRPNVVKLIRELNPEVIILLGGDAVRSVIGWLWKTNTGPIGRWAGWQAPSVQLNAWVCPTYQPAQMFHNDDPVLEMDFTDHLRSAVALAGTRPHPDGPPDYESRVEVIRSADAAAARLRKYTSGVIAFDFETDRKKPDAADAEIVCCSVCWNGEETITFPWYGAVKPEMKRLLTDPQIGKIGALIKFEDRWCRAKLGIEVRGWMWCVVTAAHLLDPRGGNDGKDGKKEAGITGLKFQSFVQLGVGDYNHDVEPFLKSKEKGGNAPNRIREAKLDRILLYCGMDSLLEYVLAQIQMKRMGW